MLVVCNNYTGGCRFRKNPSEVGYHKFNFRFNQKHGVKNDNKHKRFSYFGESYKRFDNKVNKISYHDFKRNLAKRNY